MTSRTQRLMAVVVALLTTTVCVVTVPEIVATWDIENDSAWGFRDQVDLDALTSELLTAATSTFQPAHASLWLKDEVRP